MAKQMVSWGSQERECQTLRAAVWLGMPRWEALGSAKSFSSSRVKSKVQAQKKKKGELESKDILIKEPVSVVLIY